MAPSKARSSRSAEAWSYPPSLPSSRLLSGFTASEPLPPRFLISTAAPKSSSSSSPMESIEEQADAMESGRTATEPLPRRVALILFCCATRFSIASMMSSFSSARGLTEPLPLRAFLLFWSRPAIAPSVDSSSSAISSMLSCRTAIEPMPLLGDTFGAPKAPMPPIPFSSMLSCRTATEPLPLLGDIFGAPKAPMPPPMPISSVLSDRTATEPMPLLFAPAAFLFVVFVRRSAIRPASESMSSTSSSSLTAPEPL